MLFRGVFAPLIVVTLTGKLPLSCHSTYRQQMTVTSQLVSSGCTCRDKAAVDQVWHSDVNQNHSLVGRSKGLKPFGRSGRNLELTHPKCLSWLITGGWTAQTFPRARGDLILGWFPQLLLAEFAIMICCSSCAEDVSAPVCRMWLV